MAEQAGQVLRMARPAAWWAKRASLQHRRGNRRQAEALYQHAVALTPDDVPLKLAYARVLQELRRYEASNRQAFAALAQDPLCAPCAGLIGQNLEALGYPEEAADAFAHAMRGDTTGMADVWAEQLDRLEEALGEPADCGVRYGILMRRAEDYLSAGEWEPAKRMLIRARALPRKDERCHELLSLCHKAQGNIDPAIREAAAACRTAPRSARAYCALAGLYGDAHRRGKALRALLLAAARVTTAGDERLLCETALTLRFPAAPLKALEAAGARVQTLYDKAVLLLAAGQTQRALRALDRCRALDPDDVPARCLQRTAQAIAALPRGQAAEQIGGLRLYPALSDADSEACYRGFYEALSGGAEAFARRLQADPALYRLTLYLAETPQADISGVLEQVFPYLSENFTLKLLREILLLPAGGLAEKQLAVGYLTREKARPFVLWYGGRLSFIMPYGDGDTNLRLKDHLIYFGREGCDPRLMTYALRLIRRMSPRTRAKAAAAESGAFLAAVRMRYAQARGGAASRAVSGPRHVRRLYRMLRRAAAPAPKQTLYPPQFWLAGGREENR